MSKTLAGRELQEALIVGNVENACILAARYMHAYGASSTQDLLLQHVFAMNERTVQLVSFLANRFTMCTHVRYRKDPVSYQRLICEMVATLANYNKVAKPVVKKSVQTSMQDVTKSASILKKYCTADSYTIIQQLLKGEDCINNLLAIKDYSIEVPVASVTSSLSKDPVWIVWRILTEAYTYDNALSKYVANLYTVFKIRYRKQVRKDGATLLRDALQSVCHKTMPFGADHVYTNVAIEAAWKIRYVHLDLEERNACNNGTTQDTAPDILTTMLL